MRISRTSHTEASSACQFRAELANLFRLLFEIAVPYRRHRSEISVFGGQNVILSCQMIDDGVQAGDLGDHLRLGFGVDDFSS